MIDELPDIPVDDWTDYQSRRFASTTDRAIDNIPRFLNPSTGSYEELRPTPAPAAPQQPDAFAADTSSQIDDLTPSSPLPTSFAPTPSASVPPPTDYGTVPTTPERRPIARATAPSDPSLVAEAMNAAERYGVDPQLYVHLIQQESAFNPRAGSPAGAQGLAQLMPDTARGLGVSDPFDPLQSLDGGAKYLKQQLDRFAGDPIKALAAYNAGPGAVDKYGGVPPYEETQRYVDTIIGRIAQEQVDTSAQTGVPESWSPGPTEALRRIGSGLDRVPQTDISQFGDPQLTAEEAYAACGPAAAVRFAQKFGRNPTLREAVDLARQVGWTSAQGMAGLQSEKTLMDKLGVPTKLVSGAQWDTFAAEAQTGNPVTISTTGHYYTADGYDPSSGAFHVGRSGLDLKGGKEWMTPAEMERLMGAVQGGLLADNPQVPAPSSADAGEPSWWDRTRSAVEQGFSTVSDVVGGAVQRVAQTAEDIMGPAPTYQAAQVAEPEPITAAERYRAQAAVGLGSDVLTNPPIQTAPTTPPVTPSNLPPATETFAATPPGRFVGQVQTPTPGEPLYALGPVGQTVGTAASALGTGVHAAIEAQRAVNPMSQSAIGLAGSEQYSNEYAARGGVALQDEYNALLRRFEAGDRSVEPRMDEIGEQLNQINAEILQGRPYGQAIAEAAERNPRLPALETAANVAGAAIALPLAAEGAPMLARIAAEILQPGTNPLEIIQGARQILRGAEQAGPETAQAVRTAWESFGQRWTNDAAARERILDQVGHQNFVQRVADNLNEVLQGVPGGVVEAGRGVGQAVRAAIPGSAAEALRSRQAGAVYMGGQLPEVSAASELLKRPPTPITQTLHSLKGEPMQRVERAWQQPITQAQLDDATQTLQQITSDTGRVVGAPDIARTPEGLARLRNVLLHLAQEGESQKDWYIDSSNAIDVVTQGNKQEAEKLAQLIGLYSPKTPVSDNTNRALTAWYQFKAGVPITPGMDWQKQAATDLLYNNNPWEGRKTNNFYRNLMQVIDPEVYAQLGKETGQSGVTADIWITRAFHYLTSGKNPKATGLDRDYLKAPSPRQYDFIQDEVTRLANDLGWKPEQVQAAIWTATKAGSEGKTVERAGYHYGHAIAERTGQVSWETSPGSTAIQDIPGYANASPAERQQYHDRVAAAFRDEQGRDTLAQALEVLGGNTFDVQGVYRGGVAPGAQTLVPMPMAPQSRGGVDIRANRSRVLQEARAAISAYAAARGLLLKQDAVPWTRLFAADTRAEATAAVVDIGRTLSQQEAAAITSYLDRTLGADSHAVVSTDRGAWILSMDNSGVQAQIRDMLTRSDAQGGLSTAEQAMLKGLQKQAATENEAFQKAVRSSLEPIHSIDDARVQAHSYDSEYVSNDWERHPNGEGYRDTIRLGGKADQFGRVEATLAERIRAAQESAATELGWRAEPGPGAGRAGASGGAAAATARGLPTAARVSGEVAPPFATIVGGGAAGGAAGYESDPNAPLGERLARGAAGAIVGGLAGAAGGRALAARAAEVEPAAARGAAATERGGLLGRQRGEVFGGGRLPPEDASKTVSQVNGGITPRATRAEQILDSGLIVPGTRATESLSQILGPRGEVLSTVAAREKPPGVGVAVSTEGLRAMTPPSKEVVKRMPNLAKLATDMPEVQATIQRTAEENPELINAFRQGRVSHQELINDLAPKLGMTADDFLRTPVGRGFNPEELLVLRTAVAEHQNRAVRLADAITRQGGVEALNPQEKAQAIAQLVDAARLQAVGRGAAATAGRTLNQQKIVIDREMAAAITGSNEARAAQRAFEDATRRQTQAQTRIAALERARSERALSAADRAELRELMQSERGIAAEVRAAQARQTRAAQVEARVGERQQQQAARILEKLGGQKVTDQVLQRFVELQQSGDPLAAALFLRSLGNTSWWDRIGILRYASMLSATSTHLTNAMGNAIMLGLDVGLKPLSVGVDIAASAVTGGPRTRYMAEIPQQVRGMLEGVVAGTKDAAVELRTGIRPQQAARLDQVRSGFNSGNQAVDMVAEAPLRLLGAADSIFRGSARGGQVRALATRQAIREGLSAAGAAREARINEIVANLADFPDLIAEAEKSAARVVLQESRAEVAGIAARRGTGPAQFLQSLFLPFVRTPYNIAAQGVGMTPAGFAGAIKAARDGNRGEAADRAARALFGTAVMGVAGGLGIGGFLTGPMPEDPSTRSTLPPGWQPWALRIPREGGAMYIRYQNLGPVGVPIAIAAVMTEAARQGKPFDLGRAVAGFGRFMVDQTFLQGLDNVIKAIEEPDRYAENITEGLASSYMPYGALQRQIERAMGMATRDPHGAVEALQASFVPTSEQIRPRTTALGEPVPQGQSGVATFVSPLRYEFEQDEPTLRLLRESGVGVPAVPKTIAVPNGRIDLTQQEQEALKRARGQAIADALQPEIQSPRFELLGQEAKTRRLTEIRDRATKRANDQFLRQLSDEEFRRRREEGRLKAQRTPFQVGPFEVGS